MKPVCVDCGVPNERRARRCRACYRAYRGRTALERFWAKVDLNGPLWDSTPCWPWAAGLVDGYGKFWVNGRHVRAHRFAYETYVGPIPEGMELDHLCRNRACVNWEHMEVVVHQVNILRGIAPSALNAAKTHCPEGHPLDGLNTLIWGGKRRCRTCHREWARKRYHANIQQESQVAR